jgi:hypothetical protein
MLTQLACTRLIKCITWTAFFPLYFFIISFVSRFFRYMLHRLVESIQNYMRPFTSNIEKIIILEDSDSDLEIQEERRVNDSEFSREPTPFPKKSSNNDIILSDSENESEHEEPSVSGGGRETPFTHFPTEDELDEDEDEDDRGHNIRREPSPIQSINHEDDQLVYNEEEGKANSNLDDTLSAGSYDDTTAAVTAELNPASSPEAEAMDSESGNNRSIRNTGIKTRAEQGIENQKKHQSLEENFQAVHDDTLTGDEDPKTIEEHNENDQEWSKENQTIAEETEDLNKADLGSFVDQAVKERIEELKRLEVERTAAKNKIVQTKVIEEATETITTETVITEGTIDLDYAPMEIVNSTESDDEEAPEELSTITSKKLTRSDPYAGYLAPNGRNKRQKTKKKRRIISEDMHLEPLSNEYNGVIVAYNQDTMPLDMKK